MCFEHTRTFQRKRATEIKLTRKLNRIVLSPIKNKHSVKNTRNLKFLSQMIEHQNLSFSILSVTASNGSLILYSQCTKQEFLSC